MKSVLRNWRNVLIAFNASAVRSLSEPDTCATSVFWDKFDACGF